MIRNWNVRSIAYPPRRREELEIKLITDHVYRWSPIKIHKLWAQRASKLANTWRCWLIREDMENPSPPPYIAWCISSIWLLLSCIFCNKLGDIGKHFPEHCEPFYQIIKHKEGVMGTPNLFYYKVRRLGLVTGILRGGGILVGLPLTWVVSVLMKW